MNILKIIAFIIHPGNRHWVHVCVCSVAQLSLTLCDPMDCWSLSGSSFHGISQERILQWVAISYSRVSSQPRDWTWVSCVFCTGGQILYHCSTCEALYWAHVACKNIWLSEREWGQARSTILSLSKNRRQKPLNYEQYLFKRVKRKMLPLSIFEKKKTFCAF